MLFQGGDENVDLEEENADDEPDLTPADMAAYLYETQQFEAFYSAMDRLVNDSKVSTSTTWRVEVRLVGFLTSSSTTKLYRGRVPRLSSDNFRAATHETEWRDHDFCLSRSHYTDTDPTSRERAATAAIEPRTSSPGTARSTD